MHHGLFQPHEQVSFLGDKFTEFKNFKIVCRLCYSSSNIINLNKKFSVHQYKGELTVTLEKSRNLPPKKNLPAQYQKQQLFKINPTHVTHINILNGIWLKYPCKPKHYTQFATFCLFSIQIFIWAQYSNNLTLTYLTISVLCFCTTWNTVNVCLLLF